MNSDISDLELKKRTAERMKAKRFEVSKNEINYDFAYTLLRTSK